ncbi:hypothetical protein Pcinc_027352 [Petrolisthes cinctipes]|uniref:alpha-mannosidase n=1 Tax=Petrolisthes cinctipes TaxID=88211 RepID=A0AAE1F570_PETCI|nr:hypothetical protein Pcinc_027352 [Petrolisthes cinctipes]
MDTDVTASSHKHQKSTLSRIQGYITHNQFHNVNLLAKLRPHIHKLDRLSHWKMDGEEGVWQKWTFNNIMRQRFQQTSVGQTFGPLWSTHWFRLEIHVPEEWVGQEVWLRWNSQTEAMLWSQDGEPLQGLSPRTGRSAGNWGSPSDIAAAGLPDQTRTDYKISHHWKSSPTPLVLFVEAACNTMFGGGTNTMISPPDKNREFKIETAEIFTLRTTVYKLLLDLEVLHDLAKILPKDNPTSYHALYTANQMINFISQDDLGSASKIADTFLSKRPGDLTHTLALIGNCHIDSAWLWPYSESKRKCARSWLSTLRLMEEYPEMKFACSQAQQFTWVKEHYPVIYEKIQGQVKEGRFIPVGGTWVEMDGLIPSGESFVRQFLYGQMFFQKEFGMLCKEFWLPDTFGYSAQFPQICKLFGIERFLTQKLSWNAVNKFPHHTFLWEGLDGSTILTHFPPGDSYEMQIKVEEVIQTVRNLQDKGRVSISALLYGHGDGGGGPTREMLERSRRLASVDGCPRLKHMSPDSFFKTLEAEQRNLCRWTGELYLELHNGTYTSQAWIKGKNRACEFFLRDTEMLLAVAAVKGKLSKQECHEHQDTIVSAWHKVLLNQFHDVIPGTSINLVYKDAQKLYQQVNDALHQILCKCRDLILKGDGEMEQKVVLNTLPWKVDMMEEKSEVVSVDRREQEPNSKRARTERESSFLSFEVEGCGWRKLIPTCPPSVVLREEDSHFICENQYLQCKIDRYGRVVSLVVANDTNHRDIFQRYGSSGRHFGNQLVLYDDVPLFWDAWDTMDYHLQTAFNLNDEKSGVKVKLMLDDPMVVKLSWEMKIGSSSFLHQEISLRAIDPYLTFNTTVDWHENRKFLKVAFDTTLLNRMTSYDTQFGIIERPAHTNTSWETAKYEVCGHKWADLSEYDFGVAVLNDGKYGWSSQAGRLTLSLLRSPKSPDPECDMQSHRFSYALMPHTGLLQSAKVQQRAYEFNMNRQHLGIRNTTLSEEQETWFSVVGNGVMLETVKLAEDRSGAMIVRLYEMHGSSSKVSLKLHLTPNVKEAHLCCGLEIAGEELSVNRDDHHQYIALKVTPFKIINVRLVFH